MSTAMNEDLTTETNRDSGNERVTRESAGSALAILLAQPVTDKKPASLRETIKDNCKDIRLYIDSGGTWDETVEALAKDLGRKINRKTVETYMADFFPAKQARKEAASKAMDGKPSASDAPKPLLASPPPVVGPSRIDPPGVPARPTGGQPNPFLSPRRPAS